MEINLICILLFILELIVGITKVFAKNLSDVNNFPRCIFFFTFIFLIIANPLISHLKVNHKNFCQELIINNLFFLWRTFIDGRETGEVFSLSYLPSFEVTIRQVSCGYSYIIVTFMKKRCYKQASLSGRSTTLEQKRYFWPRSGPGRP